MKKTVCSLISLITLSACQTTQTPPENLDNFSSSVKAAFVSYKHGAKTHKAFAVAKYRQRGFFGYGASYPSVEEAEQRALAECQSRAQQFKADIQCFIYHSE